MMPPVPRRAERSDHHFESYSGFVTGVTALLNTKEEFSLEVSLDFVRYEADEQIYTRTYVIRDRAGKEVASCAVQNTRYDRHDNLEQEKRECAATAIKAIAETVRKNTRHVLLSGSTNTRGTRFTVAERLQDKIATCDRDNRANAIRYFPGMPLEQAYEALFPED